MFYRASSHFTHRACNLRARDQLASLAIPDVARPRPRPALGPSPAPRPSPKVTPSLPKDAILLVSYYGGQFQIALPPIPSSAIRGYTVREKLSTPSPPTRPRVGQRACDA